MIHERDNRIPNNVSIPDLENYLNDKEAEIKDDEPTPQNVINLRDALQHIEMSFLEIGLSLSAAKAGLSPKIFACGQFEGCLYMFMEAQPFNLDYVLKEMSLSDTKIAHLSELLEDRMVGLEKLRLLYVDAKPPNVVVNNDMDALWLVDFDPACSSIVPPVLNCKFEDGFASDQCIGFINRFMFVNYAFCQYNPQTASKITKHMRDTMADVMSKDQSLSGICRSLLEATPKEEDEEIAASLMHLLDIEESESPNEEANERVKTDTANYIAWFASEYCKIFSEDRRGHRKPWEENGKPMTARQVWERAQELARQTDQPA